jgi:flagellar biosynthesis chaperone FliJ
VTTIKPRVVRALKDARTRLRDVAAAAHSNATAESDRSARALEDEHDTLETALDAATTALAEARTIHALDNVAAHTSEYRLSLADAMQRHADASAVTETAADRLRERTRQLRTAERLVDRVERHRAKREARSEQIRIDDLNGRRRPCE